MTRRWLIDRHRSDPRTPRRRAISWLLLASLSGSPGCPTAPIDDDDNDDADDDDDDDGAPFDLEADLRTQLAALKVPPRALEPVTADPALVALGEALFFDPVLSGSKDVACASCHHPAFATSDGLSLSLGVGAVGRGPERGEGPHPPFIARHATALFNLGDPAVRTLFWDGRVATSTQGLFTPAGLGPVVGVTTPLAGQALFPLLDRAEMRGGPSELAVDGSPNELGALPDDDPHAVWAAIVARIEAVPDYAPLLLAAAPELEPGERTIALVANAIAAYQAVTYSFTDAPWDRWLRGDASAMRDDAKLGARLFFGVSGCGACHSGALLSDQEFHGTGIPQLGPGKPGAAPYDHGREHATGDPADRFAFRTPPLRNVALSAPYMHDGSLRDLAAVLAHYDEPRDTVPNYDASWLHPDLRDTVQQDPEHVEALLAALSPALLDDGGQLVDLSNLRAFMNALTDPRAEALAETLPGAVPSGLPVP